jgi:hypothetical protein
MVALAAVLAMSLAGCSPVTGTALSAAPLDVGAYPTTAVAAPVLPPLGTLLEGQRMAASVVLPSEVDPSLRGLETTSTGPVPDAQALRADIRQPRALIAEAHGFIAGFSSARSTLGEPTPTTSVVNLVMRFPDAGAAAAAAAEMIAAEPARPTAIAHHRDAVAQVLVMPRGFIVESFTPHGPYVLYQWVQTRNTLEAASNLVAGILDRQGTRIDAFTPTDPSRLGQLPTDPSGLMAHTLPPAVGVYPAPGALHFERDPAGAADVFAAAAVTAVAQGRATVYRSENSTSASLLVDTFVSDEMTDGAVPADPVSGVPDAPCVDRGATTPSRYACYGTSGRYAFATTSEHLQDARQQAAAQYLLLGGL